MPLSSPYRSRNGVEGTLRLTLLLLEGPFLRLPHAALRSLDPRALVALDAGDRPLVIVVSNASLDLGSAVFATYIYQEVTASWKKQTKK